MSVSEKIRDNKDLIFRARYVGHDQENKNRSKNDATYFFCLLEVRFLFSEKLI